MTRETAHTSACPLCASARAEVEHENVLDLLYKTPGRWSWLRCLDCRALYLTPRPDDPVSTYPENYTQHVSHTLPDIWGDRLFAPLRLLRRGVLQAYGYRDYGVLEGVIGWLCTAITTTRIGALYNHVLLPPAVPGGRILDVGCGGGQLFAVLKELGWTVCGVEPDPASFKIAKKYTGGEIHPALESAPFEDGSFDCVLMNHVLEHVYNPAATLKNCRRLLKDDGRLGICVPNCAALTHSFFGRFNRNLDPPRHVVMFEPAVLRALLEKSGFDVKETYTTSMRYAQDTFRDGCEFKFGRRPFALLTRTWQAVAVLLDVLFRLRGEELVIWAVKKP